MSRNTLIAVVVILVLFIGGWYLTRSKATTSQTAQPTEIPSPSASSSAEATSGATMSQVKEIAVSGTDFAFSPSKISFNKGDKVKIVFQNNGKFPHNLVIDELSVASKTINSGQTDSVEFTADKSGAFTMYCSVDSHRQKGMMGSVSVQ